MPKLRTFQGKKEHLRDLIRQVAFRDRAYPHPTQRPEDEDAQHQYPLGGEDLDPSREDLSAQSLHLNHSLTLYSVMK